MKKIDTPSYCLVFGVSFFLLLYNIIISNFDIMATKEEFDDVIKYKTSRERKYRDGLSENQKRNIRRDKASRYVVRCNYCPRI